MEEKKKRIEYFLILLKTDNLFENKDLNDLIIGKYGFFKNENNKRELAYKIYRIKINNKIDIKLYLKLLLEGDFAKNNFKKVDIDKLKNEILSKKSDIKRIIFTGGCGGLKKYINENFEK